MENESKPIVDSQKDNKGMGCVWLMIISAVAIIVLACCIVFINNPITKKEPTIEIETTLNSILFNIQAKDNYKYIIFDVELLDKNKNISKSFTMREDNLKKGELRQAEYKFALGEIFTSEYVYVKIKEFK